MDLFTFPFYPERSMEKTKKLLIDHNTVQVGFENADDHTLEPILRMMYFDLIPGEE